MTHCDFNIYTPESELDRLREIILKHGKKTVICKNDFFVQVGDICNEIAYIKRGCFKYTVKTNKQKERILAFMFENEFIANYIPTRNHSQALLNIQAMEDAVVYKISIDEHLSFFEKSINEHIYVPKFVEIIAFQFLLKSISLASQTPEERYFHLQERVPQIFTRVNIKDIASYICVSPETLSRMRTSYLYKD